MFPQVSWRPPFSPLSTLLTTGSTYPPPLPSNSIWSPATFWEGEWRGRNAVGPVRGEQQGHQIGLAQSQSNCLLPVGYCCSSAPPDEPLLLLLFPPTPFNALQSCERFLHCHKMPWFNYKWFIWPHSPHAVVYTILFSASSLPIQQPAHSMFPLGKRSCSPVYLISAGASGDAISGPLLILSLSLCFLFWLSN